jgi:hypothetical protein
MMYCRHNDIKLGDGYNTYNQAMNRLDWVPMVDDDGFPMKDGDGQPLIKPDKQPGTITCAWKYRVAYKQFKRLSYVNRSL